MCERERVIRIRIGGTNITRERLIYLRGVSVTLGYDVRERERERGMGKRDSSFEPRYKLIEKKKKEKR
jgi:hypothetical protein